MIDSKEIKAAANVWNEVALVLTSNGWFQDPEDPYWWSHADRPHRHSTMAAYQVMLGVRK